MLSNTTYTHIQTANGIECMAFATQCQVEYQEFMSCLTFRALLNPVSQNSLECSQVLQPQDLAIWTSLGGLREAARCGWALA